MLKIGHRGAKGHIAENTLPSFKKAIALGAQGVEFDVHVCATGELIVLHDFTVDRTTNGSGEVHKLTLAGLKALQVEESYSIPTPDEVLEVLGKDIFVNIEMKGRHTAQPVAAFIGRCIADKGYTYTDFIVSSFQWEELEALHSINPHIPLGVLTQASVAQAMVWAAKFKAVAIHPHFSLLTESNVQQAHDAGYRIYTWTVNEPDDIARVKAMGVDGIITDYPDRL